MVISTAGNSSKFYLNIGDSLDLDINSINLRKVFDSSGNYTVEATVSLAGVIGTASAPSGKSTGKNEVMAFPGGDVDSGIRSFNHVAKELVGKEATSQEEIDKILKENAPKIGGNICTAVSIAAARSAASSLGLELYDYVYQNFTKKLKMKLSVPKPLGNIIGGGVHSQNSGMSIQEILVAAESHDAQKNIMINSQFHKLVGKEAAKSTDSPLGVNMERAWVLPFGETKSLKIASAVKKTLEEKYSTKITIGIDFAASSMYTDGNYKYKDNELSTEQQLAFVELLHKEYQVGILEDPFDEEDYDSFARLTGMIGNKALIVGDDLYTTDYKRIETGADKKATNAVLIKVNQIGTLTETIKAVYTATKNDMKTIISHRSSETTDNFIAHLGVAFGSAYIKTGTIGGERISKLNELMRIDKIINH